MTLQDSKYRDRVLVIDDNEAIHLDFRSILERPEYADEFREIESKLFDDGEEQYTAGLKFQVDGALQGRDGLEMLKKGIEEGYPYTIAFVDMRMPPGWDGLETIENLWKADPELQIIICTAYSDYSWAQIAERIGPSDNFLILKKPFDTAEVQQIASALARKWHLARQARQKQEELERLVGERTEKLRETNQALEESLSTLQRTHARLLQSEKMAALGGLVAGVAHEVNTPLGVGVTASSYLEEKVEQFADLQATGMATPEEIDAFMKNAAESSKIILSNLKRAADLIRSFKQVAVDQSTEKRRLFNLGKYIDEVLVSLRPETKRAKHTIAVNCPGNLIINSFPGAFSQLITNFVMNSLTHGFKNTDTGSIAIDVEVISDKISFRYSDNGVGISQEDLGKIYEPFFTTNRQAGDSGLGLNIVYNVVTVSLGGTIECTSTEGGGTVFHVEIPNINGV